MAIAIEGTPSYGVSEAGTYTAETTGTNRLLVICITGEDSSTPDINTSVTFGGVACTSVVEKRSGGTGGPYQTASIFYLKQADIPSGAQAIAVDFDSGALTSGPFFDCFTLSGVDQTTPVDDFVSTSLDNVAGTSFSGGVTLDTNTNGGLSFAVVTTGGNATTYGTSGSWGLWDEKVDSVLNSGYSRAVATIANNGTSVTADPSWSTSQNFAAMVAAAFKPASAGTSIAPIVAHYRMLRGS
jgi:hypothetical protein